MIKPERFLSAPIPGQSLTDTPRNYAWERPPEIADYEEATKLYIDKLANQDVMDDLAVVFDGGMPIAPFVDALTTMGVGEGLHSVDVKLIVSPVIHAFIKAAMLEYGIEAKDEGYDDIAEIFTAIAVAEKQHEKRFNTLAANIESGRAFKRDDEVVWRCLTCGYLHSGDRAPDECPACAHSQAHFELLGENY